LFIRQRFSTPGSESLMSESLEIRLLERFRVFRLPIHKHIIIPFEETEVA
jgi:hypothetical protein